MALSRKKWNYIIMGASLFMIAVLSLINDKAANVPSDTTPLFDQQLPLKQLQLNDHWLSLHNDQWQCQQQVLNCQKWVQAWRTIRVSPLNTTPPHSNKMQTLTITIDNVQNPQVWRYYPREGLLQSSNKNWYQVPPSLRAELQPILAVPLQSK